MSMSIIDKAMQIVMDGSYDGVCRACGEIVDGVEPDARGYTCPCCGRPEVYGAEEILVELG